MNKKFINVLINQITENGAIHDLYKIAKYYNIDIHESDLGTGGGLYFYFEKTKTIIINYKLSYYHKLIVLAHEIAHAFLHPYENANFTSIGYQLNQKENEANYFACRLLDVIGFWDNEELCIYEHELSKSDNGFINMYRSYMNKM